MKSYKSITYNDQEGTLKLNRTTGQLQFKASSSSEATTWDLADFQRYKLRTSLDGERHFIKLLFQVENDSDAKEEIFQMSSREEITQLGKDIRRAKRRMVKRTTPNRTAPNRTAAAIDPPSNNRNGTRNEQAPRQDPPETGNTHNTELPESSSNPPPPFNPEFREPTATATQNIDDLPCVTATPIGPGVDVEASIPIITDVLLLPDEDDEENEANPYFHEAAGEEDIEISPFSERFASSLRFWDRGSQVKPKKGDRLREDGRPGCWYTFLYLLSCSMIGCWLYFFATATDYYASQGFGFLICGVLSYLLLMLYACGCCCLCCPDNSLKYLQNAKSSREVEKLMKTLINDARPEVIFKVTCWHTETYKDKDGNKKSRSVKTFDQDFPVQLLSYSDCTEIANGDIDLHEYKLTKVKLQKSLVPDQNFSDRKKQLLEQNKHRDERCYVNERMEIPGFIPHMLCIAEGREKPYMLNPTAFCLAHVLLLPALPYRLWMGYITGKVRLEIRKQICTAPVEGAVEDS